MAERRSLVRTRGAARAPDAALLTCADCHRTALDVRVEGDGYVRCFSGIGCRGKAEIALRLTRSAA